MTVYLCSYVLESARGMKENWSFIDYARSRGEAERDAETARRFVKDEFFADYDTMRLTGIKAVDAPWIRERR